ncbi:hypothetical protein A2U01_0038566 [Trifolium medium]|uniref:Uncharacterized protein n=1 Tax=Trifolium medium TaxID=97028 RepID=A0A392Q0R1_9FABA|nr:hypothetical protein [Trifolium medium]
MTRPNPKFPTNISRPAAVLSAIVVFAVAGVQNAILDNNQTE